jgi:hypothetical protein
MLTRRPPGRMPSMTSMGSRRHRLRASAQVITRLYSGAS